MESTFDISTDLDTPVPAYLSPIVPMSARRTELVAAS